MILERVSRGGPAEAAGLQVGDELLALAGQRLRSPEQLGPLLQRLMVGEELPGSGYPLLFCRDGRIRETPLRPGPPLTERWQLELDPEAAPDAADRRRRWLELVP
jgi:predicted metalloprotease with PDZ domain